MTRAELIQQIEQKQSFLCVGLDTDPNKIPSHLLKEEDPIFAFNKAIIDATHKYAVAYKPNIAFYEALGPKGWESLAKTVEYLPKDVFSIADAKRGDIGNTSTYYAKTFFETYSFDSITVAPYMGHDSVVPFLQFEGKWVIVLALTSNEGAIDFQFQQIGNSKLYEKVVSKANEWGTPENLMFVAGATRPEWLGELRKIAPDNFFLVPGVGAQGGSLAEVAKYGLNKDCGLLVNSSRGILYASNGLDFAERAAEEAQKLQEQMSVLLQNNK
jgi:orotidine-5'-phosphate decarboxylase